MSLFLLSFETFASITPNPPTEFPTLGKSLLYVAGIVFFLLLNAFFVASEFAIVKVRASQLEAEGKASPAKIKNALHVVNNLNRYLSANQLGITMASLALGFWESPLYRRWFLPC
jgi:CBS domain containing-hemolysin-like protein